MDLAIFFVDKRLNAKQRSTELARCLLDKELKPDALALFATTAKDPVRAVCLEAFELASRTIPAVVTVAAVELATEALAAQAPAVKREAGRVIGNVAHRFPKALDAAVVNLLANTDHEGPVVRWSAAFALGEIIKLGTAYNAKLIPRVKTIMETEEKASIRKIYAAALKAVKS